MASGPFPTRRLAVAVGMVLAVLLVAVAARAQYGYYGEGRISARYPPSTGIPTSGFTFCRLMYTQVRGEPMGMGWRTDYPGAERNLMIRTSELTRTRVHFESPGQPAHYVVRMTDDALFQCPFAMASDVGTIGISAAEAVRLRGYLLKGGFLWVDDFWGDAAWEQWATEIGKVLPPSDYPIVDIRPGDSLYRAILDVPDVPQVSNIQFWRGVGGSTTSERGAETREAHLRAIRDRHGRIMVLMSHNTDIADSWEREGEDPEYFYQFSPRGYAIAMDVIVTVLTH
ncbi:MAG: DUF4159 domain-containing protein [Vicinamibacterales bacterium]|nr:DUF4159 domain-containing protein [Vicinamibacterales bacterium]